jgi:hypothetical protein
MKIRFFGDSTQISTNEPIIYFPSAKVVCDYSECGLYIANKHMSVDKPMEITLSELVKMFPDETVIEAENNGIANFFRINNIKTLKDLITYFNHY